MTVFLAVLRAAPFKARWNRARRVGEGVEMIEACRSVIRRYSTLRNRFDSGVAQYDTVRYIEDETTQHHALIAAALELRNRNMNPASKTAGRRARRVAAALSCHLVIAAATGSATAAGCAFEPQGEGRVAAILDPRSFRLEDGREVLLAGIESVVPDKATVNRAPALAAILSGRDVELRGADDTPDRYGRQTAFVFVASSETSVQAELLARGEALLSATVTDKECASILTAAEATARQARRGIWSTAAAIKNPESPGDILAGIGRFTVVEGKVLSVRQSGATTYLNFGRNWTRDFAVTISRRTLAAFEAAGMAPKSLEISEFVSAAGLRRVAGRELKCSGWDRSSCLARIRGATRKSGNQLSEKDHAQS